MTKDKAKIKAQRRKHYLANREKQIADSIKWHRENRERWKARRREYRKELRDAVLLKLGNVCRRCPEADSRVLQVDHVDGDGSKDDKAYCNRSSPKYLKLVLADTAGKFQLLCGNCNIKKYWDSERARYREEGRWDKCNPVLRKRETC